MDNESDRGKLGNFLREVIDWSWKEFCEAEKSNEFTGYEASVLSLVRTCSEGKLGAIKVAIDRVDGKVETPIRVEYPKVYILYPQAKGVAELGPGESKSEGDTDVPHKPETSEVAIYEEPAEEAEVKDVVTFTLRETLTEMADRQRGLVDLILDRKKKTERGELTDEVNIPKVKSIIAANLLSLAMGGKNFEAVMEVFDQIDGKLVETYKILGQDMFLKSYLLEAPYGAKKNKNGVYQIEVPSIANTWKEKFKQK